MVELASNMKAHLPPGLVDFLSQAGQVAHNQGLRLYLVGGVVRDLLLERENIDIDLVVEGNAIDLAHKLTERKPGKITAHPRFNTAKIQWDEWSIDLATTRSETYARPGALPVVKPSSINSDLFRRDFTINAMAISLNPDDYGKLIDLYGGMADLKNGFLRTLHEKSFSDDATRILRGLRYQQRLNFQFEPATLHLLKRDIPMLDTISGDRIRHELELILKEEYPERAIRQARELEVLAKLHSSLEGNGWLGDKFKEARELTYPNPPPVGLYLALLAYHLTGEEIEQMILRLKLPRSLAQTLRETFSIKSKIKSLAASRLAPSHTYYFLHGYSPLAITANSIASDSPVAHRNIRLYLNKLRYVKPVLNGDDLKSLGIPPGPRIKEILKRLHEARLDGEATSKNDEERLVMQYGTG
ncbi:CCA tRNA nucleotidyltransferase [Chloroflexota bacterium]